MRRAALALALATVALAPAPADRYPSARALLEDIERYLADEPVTAYREPFVARARRWGIEDLNRQYDLTELAKGDCIFAATGVTDGSLLKGVKRLKGGTMTTESVVMRASSGTVRWVRGEHHKPR